MTLSAKDCGIFIVSGHPGVGDVTLAAPGAGGSSALQLPMTAADDGQQFDIMILSVDDAGAPLAKSDAQIEVQRNSVFGWNGGANSTFSRTAANVVSGTAGAGALVKFSGGSQRLVVSPVISARYNFPAGAAYVFLSRSVVSDAAGSIGYGSKAPTGADQTSAVQAEVDRVPAGGVLVWDVAVGLSGPIYLPSDITVFAPGRQCGAIMRSAANSPMFRLKGMRTAPNVATDATSQKWFGKQDPNHAGNTAYRILDTTTYSGGAPQYLNNVNVAIVGGTWNGNRAQQTSDPFTSTCGFNAIVQFYGCQNVLLQGCSFLKPMSAIAVHFANWQNVVVRDCEWDLGPITAESVGGINGVGGLQFNGPGDQAAVDNPTTHCDDDHVAFNADDSTAAQINATYATRGSPASAGVNWVQCGDITNAVVRNLRITKGRENVESHGCLRLLTSVHLIDNVLFDGQYGNTAKFACNIGTISGLQITGNGNLGFVEFRDFRGDLDSPANQGAGQVGNAFFDIQSGGTEVRVTARKRGTVPASGLADISFLGSGDLNKFVLEGEYYDPTSSSPVAAPQILCGANVDRIHVRTYSDRNSSVSAVAAPVLKTARGCAVGFFDFAGALERATNVVDHQAGILKGVALQGRHSYANGGSPVTIATGLTITTAWYKDLAFVSGNGFMSGAGAVTNDNVYADPP
jgi:hypothetical protein